jgi:hypothetical protein
MMQQPIGVVKNLPLGNLLVAIMRAKLRQRPIGDILPPIRAERSPVEELNHFLFNSLGIFYFAFPDNKRHPTEFSQSRQMIAVPLDIP